MTVLPCQQPLPSGVGGVSSVSEGLPPVRCVTYDYGHHASASGYGRLVEYLAGPWQPSKLVKLLGDTVLRLPAKYISMQCGLFEYSRHSFTAECAIVADSLFRQPGVWHHLYAEKSFLWSGRFGRLRGNRQVGTFHHHPAKFPRMVARTHQYRRLDHAIAVSTAQMEMLETIVGSDRVTFVPHGVDTEYWRPADRPAPGRRRLVFAGNHMRDFGTLARVVDAVLAARDDVEFVLMSYDLQCAPIAPRRGVRWLVRVDDEVYRWEMAHADMLVLPLLYSTAVNSVLEALACGVPVVTTRGGISDYVDDGCAIEVAPGDAAEMADAVLALLDEPERLACMGASARKKAQQFAWPRVAERMRTVYRDVLGLG